MQLVKGYVTDDRKVVGRGAGHCVLSRAELINVAHRPVGLRRAGTVGHDMVDATLRMILRVLEN